MRILITGANGYLGKGIVKELLDLGHSVIATDFNESEVDERAEFIKGNIFEIENPFEYYNKPDILLHLAWRDGFIHYSDSHFLDLPKHVDFIKKIAVSDIKLITIMGSVHEVGFFEGSVNENTPCWPQSFYGICKNALRDASKILCEQNNKKFQWLRAYYIVGNSPHGSSIFSKITSANLNNKKTFPFTFGLNQFDFLNYNDFSEQVALTITQSSINGIINICSGRPEKLSDRVERYIKENKYAIKLEYGAFPDRPYDSKAIWGDDSKISSIIKNKYK